MLKSRGILLGTVLALALGYELFTAHHLTPDPQPAAASSLTPVRELPHEVSARPSAPPAIHVSALRDMPVSGPSPAIPPRRSSAPQKPVGNIIEFKIVDGLAIAYGDVIVGKPTPGSTAKTGHYEAPTPQLWDHPEIPYLVAPDLPNPGRVEKALEYFRQNTPVSFTPYLGQGDGVVFMPGNYHCSSELGRQGGLQMISLSPDCQTPVIIHEIMHALGFVHEQSRSDRDPYVEILWDNIDDEFKPQFDVVPETFMAAYRGSSFDYHSVMLYRTNTFARQPDLPTMQSTNTSLSIDPVKQGLSEEDIHRLNRLYRFHD